MPNVSGTSNVVVVKPVLSLTAYTDGDQLGEALVLPNALERSGCTAALNSITVIDKSKQKAAMEILFFDQPVTTGADNAAINISDAEMETKFLGSVFIASAEFADTAANSYVTVTSLGMVLKGGIAAGSGKGSTNLYIVCKTRGAPTYTAVDDLVVKVGVFQD